MKLVRGEGLVTHSDLLILNYSPQQVRGQKVISCHFLVAKSSRKQEYAE